MKPVQHVILSTGVSVLFWLWLKSLPATIVCFLSGIFIDIDHHLEYWFVKKKFPWNYRELEKYCCEEFLERIYLIFHAYEWLVLLWAAIYIFDLDVVWVGLGVGLTTHLIADVLCNPIQPLGYSIIFRASRGFCGRRILTERYEKEHPTM